jgi:hypothetical protein
MVYFPYSLWNSLHKPQQVLFESMKLILCSTNLIQTWGENVIICNNGDKEICGMYSNLGHLWEPKCPNISSFINLCYDLEGCDSWMAWF